ncbi:MAG: alpha-glucan family phosphorylase, partial [SAR324 cluster bacterium]|nr:alpha-glucan family phosphorylase [SAR324 cluster bacterium]
YLLDVNLPENGDRLLTGQLYGWFSEERIAQEIILGIGGVRALQALGIKVDAYHFNDSHPVFAGIELIRQEMDTCGMSFSKAWEKVRKQIVFTTHTPVAAGNERHDHELLRYMGAYNELTFGQMLQLGGDPFSMTLAGLRLSKKANAVSELHGQTARKMWSKESSVSEIIAITNGVHNGTWQDRRIIKSINRQRALWETHQRLKRELLNFVAIRNGIELDPDKLLIGFGRRAAPYKRSDLIFRKPKVIEPYLKSGQIQIIFAGKAHPNDLTGKSIILNLYKMSQKYPKSVVFLQDYDMEIGALLTRGCDVWLNNPIRPMEASGTSGMKAAMNGVLNLSVLDGWWPEGCKHGVNGWQIGGAYEGPKADDFDSASLYKVLLKEVLPTYYKHKSKWISMMQASIRMSTKRFSAARMLREYYKKLYS